MTVLRVAAFAIAILAVVDPAVTSSRSSRPLVAVVTTDPTRDAAMSERVARVLDGRFTVVRQPIGAAGTVLVGDALPDELSELAAPVLVVLPARVTPPLRIADVRAPAASPVNARIPVEVVAEVAGGLGRRVTFDLTRGDALVDRQTQVVLADTTLLSTVMHYVPAAVGQALLKVTATLDNAAPVDSAFVVVDARDDRFDVLFFDARASWLSTFVRREVENDPRFAISNRVVTSRGLANTSGAAPMSLRDAQALSAYETIVVGSPEQLTEMDVAGLEAFMRRRAGRVVFLMERVTPAPVDRLTGVSAWRAVRLPRASDLVGLRVREIAWPLTTPTGATVVATNLGPDSSRRAVVWSIPVGAGRLFVSGALDSWHYRDPGSSSFGQFWTNIVADLSAGAPDAIDVAVSRHLVGPGEHVAVSVTVLATALSSSSDRSTQVAAALLSGADTALVRLWPTTTPGTFAGSIRAPRSPGTYQLIVSSGPERAAAPIVVDLAARRPVRDDRDLLEWFAPSRGGTAVPESRLRELPSLLASALPSASRVVTWHPMRSAWWIIPFALLLGAEWWSRRRRGLA